MATASNKTLAQPRLRQPKQMRSTIHTTTMAEADAKDQAYWLAQTPAARL
jgi:hypothetical protein